MDIISMIFTMAKIQGRLDNKNAFIAVAIAFLTVTSIITFGVA